ncbi:Flp pilus assembly protein CpaB [Glaciimonas sp. Gout2]|uniref:Flp pilus assembly protein CpaB n=1 Tax=unclassified Glaciimonas TaxID=2644401 RepID=UPI002B228DAE|nr:MULTISPECIES: Flp pilus assembly protein CpaB [unclassified Glaciimonas]MEB0013069.1 Flp pilus assembly protein CpaB [Glaciimonas sp. Cout2]MEB0083636.1 Flp pilus assembly protein CpaB [Glaciimonas sp. Gout2]
MNLTKIIAAILVIGALILASVAWWLGSRPALAPVVSGAVASNATAYPVVVAVRNLEAGKAITIDEVRLVTLPLNPAGAYTQVSAVLGKVPMTAIGTGNLITESLLASGLALKLAEGERAVAIPVDEVVGAGNRIQPGDYVDVFMTFKQGQELENSQSRLLLSRLRVLSYGAAVIGSLGSTGSTASTADGGANGESTQQSSQQSTASQSAQAAQQPARTAVLATPLADVNRLSLAIQSGKLMLALRNPTDEKIPDQALFAPLPVVISGKNGLTHDQIEALSTPDNQAFAGIALTGLAADTKSTLARRSAAPSPAASNPAPRSRRSENTGNTVEVIRGVHRESVAF